tara:strand:- start:11872 stop:12543 length:672 start_codon:yes stop_codon:yes gene_type:complete
MTGSSDAAPFPTPTIVPLGDSAMLVRFGTELTDAANRAAIALTAMLDQTPLEHVLEVVPNLVSVMLRYDPRVTRYADIAGQLRLRLFALADAPVVAGRAWSLPIAFDGPDLDAVADRLGMTVADFIVAHNAASLRVLATGFAPGFVYCGLHDAALVVPRRTEVRPLVSPGTVLFAAGQTALTATELPSGWHIIGHTDFANFDAAAAPPTRLQPGDSLAFTVAP